MLTRLILRKPFQVGRAAMCVSCSYQRGIRIGWSEASPHRCAQVPTPANLQYRHVRLMRMHVGLHGVEPPRNPWRGHWDRCWREDPTNVRPMLATLAEPPLTGPGLVYEPEVRRHPRAGPRRARTAAPASASGRGSATRRRRSFPSIVRGARRRSGPRSKAPVLIDGEIVALDEHGRPAGFQQLQGRIHLTSAGTSSGIERGSRSRSSRSTSCATATRTSAACR